MMKHVARGMVWLSARGAYTDASPLADVRSWVGAAKQVTMAGRELSAPSAAHRLTTWREQPLPLGKSAHVLPYILKPVPFGVLLKPDCPTNS